jgi:hypothetical protein
MLARIAVPSGRGKPFRGSTTEDFKSDPELVVGRIGNPSAFSRTDFQSVLRESGNLFPNVAKGPFRARCEAVPHD